MTCIKLLRALSVIAAACAIAGTAFALEPEQELAAAREAAARGQPKALEAWRQRYAGHPLEAYPSYWLMSGNLERTDPAQVRAFLVRHADSPLAESLRREWLRLLGASGSWELFRAEHPRLLADDAEVACYSFQERMARADSDAMDEARNFFLSGREAPVACDAVFASLQQAGRITVEDTWVRVRKLLAANNVREAKRAAALLPAKQSFAEKSLERAAADPAHFLARAKSADLLSRASRELALFAIVRLARAKPDEAASRLGAVQGRLDPADARFAWAHVAHQAALSHLPQALEYYAAAGDAALGDGQLAWKARAALRAREWKTVLASIQALPADEARDATWRYWRARALRELGEAPAAEAMLRTLAREPSFYGLLAAEEVGVAAPPEWNGWRPQPGDLDRARAIPGIRRALLLYRAGLDAEALREWIVAIRPLDDRDLLAAAELARIAELPDRAINTADRTAQLHDFAQRYPAPHRETLTAAAKQWGLDPAMLYAIIRQESRFVSVARSRVGAAGLMQLMPATARWVAQQIRMPYSADLLTRPEVNLQMGTYYFGRVLGELGHPILATAAYNAGPGRARRWRDAAPLEGAIYIETIPFNETRDYVKKVFANAWYYQHRLRAETPNVPLPQASLHQMLGQVPGRNGEPATSAVTAAAIP